jgi:hypothetical protein
MGTLSINVLLAKRAESVAPLHTIAQLLIKGIVRLSCQAQLTSYQSDERGLREHTHSNPLGISFQACLVLERYNPAAKLNFSFIHRRTGR